MKDVVKNFLIIMKIFMVLVDFVQDNVQIQDIILKRQKIKLQNLAQVKFTIKKVLKKKKDFVKIVVKK